MNVVWSNTELEFIRRHAGIVSDTEGAKKLSALAGRVISVSSWRKQRRKLGIFKKRGRGVCEIDHKAGDVGLGMGMGVGVTSLNKPPEAEGGSHSYF